MTERLPRNPQWFCGLTGHWGFLREIRKLDDERSEYECRSCGWRGVKKRPSNRLRWYWF
jgi:hypothetical protein